MRYLLVFAILLSSCMMYDDSYYYDDPPAEDYYWDTCHIPYWTSPEYCEEYIYDNSRCCTWNIGHGCHEEWCVWYDSLDCEWEKQWWDCDSW